MVGPTKDQLLFCTLDDQLRKFLDGKVLGSTKDPRFDYREGHFKIERGPRYLKQNPHKNIEKPVGTIIACVIILLHKAFD